jgi:ribosomal protein L37AE/L43A
VRPESQDRTRDKEMKCPGCSKTTLKRRENGVACSTCGYTLSPGEEVRFRLYEMLKSPTGSK